MELISYLSACLSMSPYIIYVMVSTMQLISLLELTVILGLLALR